MTMTLMPRSRMLRTQFEHPPSFLDTKGGHRLIHDHQPHILQQQAADGDGLALPAGEPQYGLVQFG